MVADTKALHYILHASGYSFPKRTDMAKVAEMAMGEGSGVCPWYRTLFFFPMYLLPFARSDDACSR